MYLGSEKKLKKCVSTLHNFAHNIIIERREQLRTKSSVTSSDILTSIMLSNDPELTSDKFLLDLILNLILGGRETTAVALTHLFHLLQLYPDVEERLINEFRSKKNEITQETINNMIYADAVFHETCRYMPPVPYDFKVCNEDIMLPGNIFIPKNTIITYTPYHYHRLKSIWGKDAEEFKPERWIDDEGRFKTESQYKFISFNAGPRLCLGKSMAQLEAKILFLMLLNEFQFKLKPNFNCLIKSTVTCPFQDGLPMLVSKRQY
jgi:cytochrome P450